jgi:hypothetical protein
MRCTWRIRARSTLDLGVILGMALLGACGGSRMSVEQASLDIAPKSELPARQQVQLPDNFVVKIRNVADDGSSFKNYVRLFVNGHEILPAGQVDNVTSIYTYPMRLQEGVYDVRAEYHNVGGWRGKVYQIVPDEPVQVLPSKRTVLVADLYKNEMGGLAESPTHFQLRYEDVNVASRAAR